MLALAGYEACKVGDEGLCSRPGSMRGQRLAGPSPSSGVGKRMPAADRRQLWLRAHVIIDLLLEAGGPPDCGDLGSPLAMAVPARVTSPA